MVYNRLYKNAGSSNGRTWDFESQYEGPTPSPAADCIYSPYEILPKHLFLGTHLPLCLL